MWGQQHNQPKTLIVVTIVRMPMIARRRAAILCIVVPRAAPNHTNTTLLPGCPTPKGDWSVVVYLEYLQHLGEIR
jgi:hypothetical protein